MARRETDAISDPIKAMVINGFRLAERKQPPNWRLLNHVHESTMLTLVIEGSCQEIIRGRSIDCTPKTLQVLPAGEKHELTFANASVRCLTIEVEPSRLEAIRQVSRILDQPVHIREGVFSGLLRNLYHQFRMTDNLTSLTIEGLILQVLGEAARQRISSGRISSQSPAPPRWLIEAREIIHENAREGVSLIVLATSLGVHPSYLSRMFRLFYGCSIVQYVQRVRLDYSIRELIESDKPLAQIAINAGFYDQSHFTNVFKSHLQMTPTKFRQMRQGR
jgi:AraC family transcriptional regulator